MTDTKYMVQNSASYQTDNQDEMYVFLAEIEDDTEWLVADKGIPLADMRFQPAASEPLNVSNATNNLRGNGVFDFTASDEAYLESIYSDDEAYLGSSQLLEVDGRLIPVGTSAIPGILERLDLSRKAFCSLRQYGAADLSCVLNKLLQATEGTASVQVSAEMVRAFNSGRYAVCEKTEVFEMAMDWMRSERPQAEFIQGFWCHNFTEWVVDLGAYTVEIFGACPELLNAGFTPAVVFQMSDTKKSAVRIMPALKMGKHYIPIGGEIALKHIGRGTFKEKTEKMHKQAEQSMEGIFGALKNSAEDIEKLKAIAVRYPVDAVGRALKGKSLSILMTQAYEAYSQFAMLFTQQGTAFDCFSAVVDAYTRIVLAHPDDHQVQFSAAQSVAKASRLGWAKLGEIPGFIW